MRDYAGERHRGQANAVHTFRVHDVYAQQTLVADAAREQARARVLQPRQPDLRTATARVPSLRDTIMITVEMELSHACARLMM